MNAFMILAFLLLASTVRASAETAIVHHGVSTNPVSQAAFDRGLLDYYAYNPDAAQREFTLAGKSDPQNAMAYWGIAISNAPNLNVPPTALRDSQARVAIIKAKALEANAAPEDRLFIDAAAARFAGDARANPDALQVAYRDALQHIAQTYPDDPDAATLYAEAALYAALAAGPHGYELTPSQRAVRRELVAALLPYFQTELAKFPLHVGLEHFYIHAAQIAGQSQLAVGTATQLAEFAFAPEDSHLTHMPGHIFFDVGMYDEALAVAQRSVAMDLADVACCHPGYYSATRYYHNHNVIFLLYAMTQTGHVVDAVAVARRENNDAFLAKQFVAAAQWNEILKHTFAPNKDPAIPFAIGLADAHLGNVTAANEALASIPNAAANSSAGAANIMAIRLTLAAEIAEAQHDDTKALALLTDASKEATIGQRITDPEMPVLYYFSPHMALARLAIKLGNSALARTALQAELTASPRSPAALHAEHKGNSRTNVF